MSPRRYRGFRITWYLGDLTWEHIFNVLDTVECEYIVYQEENCPTTGRRHVQGYVHFPNGKTKKVVEKIFLGANILTADRSAKENRDYCTKLDTRAEGGRTRERGVLPTQGARHDIHEARIDIEAGMNDFDMFVKYGILWARYRHAFIAHRSAMVKPRNFWTQTTVIYGDTGKGKSAKAFWLAAQNSGTVATMLLPRNQDSMVWGDGCITANTIIIEDMEVPGNINYGVLKNMLDWTPCQMPVKGMSMQWAPHFMIITSNYHPRDWYPSKEFSSVMINGIMTRVKNEWTPETNALCRRLTTNGSKIVHLTEPWSVPEDDDLVSLDGYVTDQSVVY